MKNVYSDCNRIKVWLRNKCRTRSSAFRKIVEDICATSRNKLKTNRVAHRGYLKKGVSYLKKKTHLSWRQKVDAPFSKLRQRAKNRGRVTEPRWFPKSRRFLLFSLLKGSRVILETLFAVNTTRFLRVSIEGVENQSEAWEIAARCFQKSRSQ